MLTSLAAVLRPSIGGFIGTAFGWRNLMKGLSCWGGLTILLMYFIPESNAAVLAAAAQQPGPPPANPPSAGAAPGEAEAASPPPSASPPPRPACPSCLTWSKLRRMYSNVDFVGLTVAAAINMGAARD